jgi:hypothetical protein
MGAVSTRDLVASDIGIQGGNCESWNMAGVCQYPRHAPVLRAVLPIRNFTSAYTQCFQAALEPLEPAQGFMYTDLVHFDLSIHKAMPNSEENESFYSLRV